MNFEICKMNQNIYDRYYANMKYVPWKLQCAKLEKSYEKKKQKVKLTNHTARCCSQGYNIGDVWTKLLVEISWVWFIFSLNIFNESKNLTFIVLV